MQCAIIEFLPAGAAEWDLLGRYSASDDELAVLRTLLENRDPYEALSSLPPGMMRDAIDIIRSEGHAARVLFDDKRPWPRRGNEECL